MAVATETQTRQPPYAAYAGIVGTFASGLALAAALGELLDRDAREQSALDLVVLAAATFKAARTLSGSRRSAS